MTGKTFDSPASGSAARILPPEALWGRGRERGTFGVFVRFCLILSNRYDFIKLKVAISTIY
jgi:hypothetical protein